MKKFIINLTDPNKNLTYIFTANIERGDDGRVLISCPSLPVYTEGADEAEAKKNIVEAVTMFLECSADAGHLDEILEDHTAKKDYLRPGLILAAGVNGCSNRLGMSAVSRPRNSAKPIFICS